MRILLSPYIGVTKFTTMTLHHFCCQKCYNFLDIISHCHNVTLTSSSKLEKLTNFKNNKSHIKKLDDKNLLDFYSYPGKITLDNCLLKKYDIDNGEIYLKNSVLENLSNIIMINAKKLTLENSQIISSQSIIIPFLQEIKFNDKIEDTILDTSSYLEALEHIAIGTTPYHKQNNNESIIITKETLEKDSLLLRNKLLSILKELSNEKLEKQKIKKRVKTNE